MKVDLTKLPKQAEFVFSKATYPAYMGGFANGKTYGGCVRAIAYSLRFAGNCGVIGRNNYPELNGTTRAVFFEILGTNADEAHSHPLIAYWNKTENHLRFKNGSEVWFINTEDESSWKRIKGMNLRWFYLDQVEDIPVEAFMMLQSRINRVKSHIPQSGWVTGNPAGHNWVWKMWKSDWGQPSHNPKFHLIESTTMENPFLGDGYVDDMLKTYPPQWVKRYLYGDWEAFFGQVYDEFSPAIHVIDPIPILDDWKSGLGMDFGINNPTAAIWFAVDYDGDVHIYDEHYESGHTPEWHASRIMAKGIRKNGYQLPIFGDPSMMNRNLDTGKSLQSLYEEEGIHIIPGNNQDRLIGITKIKQYLHPDKEKVNPYHPGLPGARLYIHANCIHTIEEFGLYRWKQIRPGQEGNQSVPEEPVKVNDHAMDAARYWFMDHFKSEIPSKPKQLTEFEYDMKVFEETLKNRGQGKDWRFA